MSEDLLWDRLEGELRRQVAAFPGVAGVCVQDLTHSHRVAVNADTVFPTASTIKIQILAQLLRRAEAGEVNLGRKVAITGEVKTPGSGILSYLDDVEELTVRDIAVLMILVSDNTATNLCIDWATFDGTNALIRECGLSKTMLRRKMLDTEAIVRGDENVSTPAEMVRFLELLHRAEGMSPYVCGEALTIMRKPKRSYLAPGLPEGTALAHKTGAMPHVCNDVGIVYLPNRPYAIAVMTSYGMTTSAAQEQFIAGIGQTVHEQMAMLDGVSTYGQGVPPELLGRG